MSLYVCGDIHGGIDLHKLTTKMFPEGKALTKDDYVVICGDCGVVWDNSKSDFYLQDWFDDKPWTTLFVDGNHENHDALDDMPVEEWNGGKVHRISDSILHLMRGQVFEIDGRKLFTMGGASSHDKIYRKEGISWWAKELPSDDEYQEAAINLAKNDNCVDYIFTHCAPDRMQTRISHWYEKDKLTNFLQVIDDTVEYKKWFFGHYHIDAEYDKKFNALYDDVVRVW